MKINLHFTTAAFRMGDSLVGRYVISKKQYFEEFPPIGMELIFDIKGQESIPFVIQGPFRFNEFKGGYSAKITALKSENLPHLKKKCHEDDYQTNADFVNDFFVSDWRVKDLKTSEFLSKEIDE